MHKEQQGQLLFTPWWSQLHESKAQHLKPFEGSFTRWVVDARWGPASPCDLCWASSGFLIAWGLGAKDEPSERRAWWNVDCHNQIREIKWDYLSSQCLSWLLKSDRKKVQGFWQNGTQLKCGWGPAQLMGNLQHGDLLGEALRKRNTKDVSCQTASILGAA